MAVRIGSRLVGYGYPCFVVAEIGINHNGSVEVVQKLIDAAVDAGCDAVKFQKRTVEIVYTEKELAAPRKVDPSIIENARERSTTAEGFHFKVLPAEALERLDRDPKNTTNGDLKYALEFGLKEYDLIDRYCREKGIPWFASAWDGLSAHFINGFNVPCHKIASACLTHADLLVRIRSNGKPVILSTGMSTMEQIESAVRILGREDLVVLHCVSNYPSKDEEANLSGIETLWRRFRGIPIGYSGHEPDIFPSVLAVAMGACMVERHITLDKTMPGTDQKASLEPQELTALVRGIRTVEIRMEGRDPSDVLTANELAALTGGEIGRIQALVGDGIKKIYPSEIPIMEKLRRVRNF